MRRYIPLAILLLTTTVSVSHAQPPVPKRAPVSEATQLTVRASNTFACELFRRLASAEPGKNAFFSPWSISSALAMTMEGARNDTATEMGTVLGLPKEFRLVGVRPWNIEPYHNGFAEMQRRCTPPRDLLKEEAGRARIAKLRSELNSLNKQIQAGKFDLLTKAEKLAGEINQIDAQFDQYELNIANAIWGEQTYPFEPAYLNAVAQHYGKDLVRNADFLNNFPRERKTINKWVEQQTKDKIKDLIPEMPPEVARLIRMILVNAIYFKGQWNEPFEKGTTQPEVFTLLDGTKTKTPLMRGHLPARYAAFNADGSAFDTPRMIGFDAKKEKLYPADNGFVLVDLPYKGNRLAMTLIVPRSPKGLPEIEKKLTGNSLAHWTEKLQPRGVQVWLPKFKMDTTYELADTLKAMGMPLAFDERRADFSGMSKSKDEPLHISRVIHKAFVDVNEEGTEAAAATAVIMAVPTSAPANFPFTPEVKADRPFVFVIREVDTGAVMFMGRMTTPGK
ncbi:MAG: serpin family protein [Gemmataceae bacterium]|nr:serpin family protein [Gemmataceae bacterium]